MPYSPLSDILNTIPEKKTSISTPISTLYTPPANSPIYNLPDRGARITDEDIEAFKPLLYGEVSNRDYKKKQLEGDVIFNTALNRQREYSKKGQYKTIAEILAMPKQYQAYGGKQYAAYSTPADPISAAKKKEVDAIAESIRERIRKGDYKDNTQGAYYYIHNPDESITYDNIKPLFAK